MVLSSHGYLILLLCVSELYNFALSLEASTLGEVSVPGRTATLPECKSDGGFCSFFRGPLYQ